MSRGAIAISAFGSNSGKTLLTTALLHHFRGRVRGFKIGPDFIDPQFHKAVSGLWSVNLDSFMMNKKQLKWIFGRYNDRDLAILEGVMGFYDGEDRGCSTYSVARDLEVNVVVVIDCSGSYITISALLKGLLEYRDDNSIRGVILNKISSLNHYQLIKSLLEREHKNIEVLGWIKKGIESLGSTHLGLDLNSLSRVEEISKDVLANIDLQKILEISEYHPEEVSNYPFPKFSKVSKKLALVYDRNFSFLYYDNLEFFREVFDEVVIVDSTKDEQIPEDVDTIYIAGGYVETSEAYSRVKNSHNFKKSLISHAKAEKKIYGECAGLLYLGKSVDEKAMSGILDIDFKLESRFVRLGYYFDESSRRGHCFHYTRPKEETLKKGFGLLRKRENSKGEVGSWSQGEVFGTFFHTMFRLYPELILG